MKLIHWVMFCSVLLGCQGKTHKISGQIRQPAVAGQFYPSSADELRSAVRHYLSAAEDLSFDDPVLGLVCPHAGYVYSAPVAAWSYKQLQERKYDVIVVVSPCHVDAFRFASVFNGEAYETPLGKVAIDRETAGRIASFSGNVKLSGRGHISYPGMRGEHSLEVQLPFLQVVQSGTPIVPIVIGTLDWRVIQDLGTAIGETLKNRRALVIASSDLSHYHPYEQCNRIDGALMDVLKSCDPLRFIQGISKGKFEACGAAPIASMLIATRIMGGKEIKILKHANSGDVPIGTKDRVVGYLAAVVLGGKSMRENDQELNLQEKRFLMDLARESVYNSVRKKPLPEPKEVPPSLRENRGAFVTLKKQGSLRGCIGYVLPIKPLYQTVIDVARSAALQDPRFPAVTPDELNELEFEISVLTVPHKIEDIDQIEVGKHGLIIKKGFYQGLLLPQVATEYNWDRIEFLKNTCRKAGLPSNAWKDKETEIQIFSAQVFDEKDIK